jgi:hypothetical protein
MSAGMAKRLAKITTDGRGATLAILRTSPEVEGI